MPKKLTQLDFITRVTKLHDSFYIYGKVVYNGVRNKVIITCPIHGDFLQRPRCHLKGSGCPKCGNKKRSINGRSTTEHFINKAQKKYKDKYGYTCSIYTHSNEEILIECYKHGIFSTVPCRFLIGVECPKCSKEQQKKNFSSSSWNYSGWETLGKKSKLFDSFKLYIIKCYNDNEEFYKIGKTFKKIEKRFNSKYMMPYNYTIISSIEGIDGREVSEWEDMIHKNLKQYRYTPKLRFGGSTECFK